MQIFSSFQLYEERRLSKILETFKEILKHEIPLLQRATGIKSLRSYPLQAVSTLPGESR